MSALHLNARLTTDVCLLQLSRVIRNFTGTSKSVPVQKTFFIYIFFYVNKALNVARE
jgi:hypothetical protein